jgi:hypothetical protein
VLELDITLFSIFMKKILAIGIPVVLVLCVICGVVVYFVYQSAGKQITDLQNKLTVSPSVVVNSEENFNLPFTNDSGTVIPEEPSVVASETCNVLTLDMAKQLLGADAKLASSNPGNCTYSSISGDMSSFGVLTIVVTKSNPVSAKAVFEQARTTTYANDTTPVSGLNADDAYYANTMNQLSILKGDSWIIISGTSDKFTSEKDLAVAAAKLAIK